MNMLTSNPLYQSIQSWAQRLFGHISPHFAENLALFLFTLLAFPKEPTLSDLARRTPIRGLAQSRLNRLSRFLHHKAFQNPWIFTYALLPYLLAGRTWVPILVDGTEARKGQGHLLVAALPKKRRVIPIAWALYPQNPYPSQNRVEEEFLYRLGRLVQGLGVQPVFVLDRGFDRVSLFRRLQAWGMGLVVRLRGRRKVWVEGEGWLKGHDGGRVKVRLWVGPGGEGGLYVASWGVEARGREVYRLRMWIEEGFRDLKRRGLGWGEGLRREESVLGWAGLGLLAMGVLVWVGSVLRGLEGGSGPS